MQTQPNGPDEKYGLTTSFRIPAELKRRLSDEAALRGITLSQHGAALLASIHQQAEEQCNQVGLLIRERQQLQAQLAAQAEQLKAQAQQLARLTQSNAILRQKDARPGKAEKLVVDKLQQNRAVLRRFLSSGSPVSQAALTQAGFDFRYSTGVVMHQGRQYFCVFDLCYCLSGDKVLIDTLNLDALC